MVVSSSKKRYPPELTCRVHAGLQNLSGGTETLLGSFRHNLPPNLPLPAGRWTLNFEDYCLPYTPLASRSTYIHSLTCLLRSLVLPSLLFRLFSLIHRSRHLPISCFISVSRIHVLGVFRNNSRCGLVSGGVTMKLLFVSVSNDEVDQTSVVLQANSSSPFRDPSRSC